VPSQYGHAPQAAADGQARRAPRPRVSIRYSVAKAGGSNSTMPVFSIQASRGGALGLANVTGLLGAGGGAMGWPLRISAYGKARKHIT